MSVSVSMRVRVTYKEDGEREREREREHEREGHKLGDIHTPAHMPIPCICFLPSPGSSRRVGQVALDPVG